MTSWPRTELAEAGERVAFEPSRPLLLTFLRGPLTIAVVSIAWLRDLGDTERESIEARHLCVREAAHAETLRTRSRHLEWIAGRLAIKQSVLAYQQRYLGMTLRTCDIEVRTVDDGLCAGKPVVEQPVEVGLSHSADFAIAACGPRSIGIDLESSREMPPMLAEVLTISGNAIARPDGHRLLTMPLPLRWACKEAVLKHFGFGLRVDTDEVELTGWKADSRFLWRAGPELRRLAPATGHWHFDCWAREIDNYSLAIVRTW